MKEPLEEGRCELIVLYCSFHAGCWVHMKAEEEFNAIKMGLPVFEVVSEKWIL